MPAKLRRRYQAADLPHKMKLLDHTLFGRDPIGVHSTAWAGLVPVRLDALNRFSRGTFDKWIGQRLRIETRPHLTHLLYWATGHDERSAQCWEPTRNRPRKMNRAMG